MVNFPMVQIDVKALKTQIHIDIQEPPAQLQKLPYTVIYSHSNAENILLIHNFLDEACKILQVRIISYDYLGYGLNAGKPSERSSYKIARAVYEYARKTYPCDQIISWGRSIGSSCATYIATEFKTPVLILESGLSSACEVLCKHGFICCDQFQNVDKLSTLSQNCRVLLIHGTNDETIPMRCSLRNFYALCQDEELPEIVTKYNNQFNYQTLEMKNRATHVSINNAGHNDVDSAFENALFRSIIDFLGDQFKQCKIENKLQRREHVNSKPKTRKDMFGTVQ